jgi:hypothetical protein
MQETTISKPTNQNQPNKISTTTSATPSLGKNSILTSLNHNDNSDDKRQATKITQQLDIRNPYLNGNRKAAGVFSYKKRVNVQPQSKTSTTFNQDQPCAPENTTVNLHDKNLPGLFPSNPSPDTHINSLRTNTNTHHQDEISQFSSQSTFRTSKQFIPINDGTQRLTVRWKTTDQFEQLNADKEVWDNDAVKMIHDLFHIFAEKINIVTWEDKKGTAMALNEVSSDNLRTYLSPRVSALPSIQTFIFGIRPPQDQI